MKTVILAYQRGINTEDFLERCEEIGCFNHATFKELGKDEMEVEIKGAKGAIGFEEFTWKRAGLWSDRIEALTGQVEFILVPAEPLLLEELGNRNIFCNVVLLRRGYPLEEIISDMVEAVAVKNFHDVFHLKDSEFLPDLVKIVTSSNSEMPFLTAESKTSKLYHETIMLLSSCPYQRFFKTEIFKVQRENDFGREKKSVLRRKAEILENAARECVLSGLITEKEKVLEMRALVEYIQRVKEEIR